MDIRPQLCVYEILFVKDYSCAYLFLIYQTFSIFLTIFQITERKKMIMVIFLTNIHFTVPLLIQPPTRIWQPLHLHFYAKQDPIDPSPPLHSVSNHYATRLEYTLLLSPPKRTVAVRRPALNRSVGGLFRLLAFRRPRMTGLFRLLLFRRPRMTGLFRLLAFRRPRIAERGCCKT